jgi:hypothetical protein
MLEPSFSQVPASETGARVTIVRNHNGRLTKRIELQDGKLDTSTNGAVASGAFETVPAETPSALATIIKRLGDNEALIHGAAIDGALTGRIVTQKAIEEGTAPAGAVARSMSAFAFPADRAGILMLDLDVKEVPESAAPTTLDNARARLVAAVPGLTNAPMLAIPSASANILRAGTEVCMRGLSGIRVYVWIANAADAKTIGTRLHQRLMLAGAGFAKITTDGRLLPVSIIDTAVWSPERLDFAAGASCGEGLEQRRGSQVWHDEGAPIALEAVPALTPSERDQLKTISAEIIAKAQPEATRRRAEWLTKREKEGRKTAVAFSDDSSAVEHLDAAHEIRLASKEWVTIGDVLRDPVQYDGVKCYDPIEPGYDGERVVAIIYARQSLIHSKAHGGINYPLHVDAADEFSAGDAPPDANAAATLAPKTPREAVEQINTQAAFVRSLGLILYQPTPQTYELHKPSSVRDFLRNVTVRDGKKIVPAYNLWSESEKRRTISALAFEPDLPPLAVAPSLSEDPLPIFNTWPGLAIAPSPEGSCDLFLRHLRDVIADGDEGVYMWILMWLASIVQSPAELSGTALVLRGPQGAGKDFVGEVMREIIGPRLHLKIADPNQLTGEFNASHEGKLLLQVEEGFFAGNPKDRGKLKSMITSPVVTINKKGVDAYQVRNCARVLITSNESWVVPAELGDRRSAVLNVSGAHANDLPYHSVLRRQMFEQGGCARLLHYLLNEVVVDWGVIRRPPATEGLRDQQLLSLNPELRWLHSLLDSGALPGDEDGSGVVLKTELLASFATSGVRNPTPAYLTQFLKPYGVEPTRKRIDGPQKRAYQFPPLALMRERFGADFAVPLEWEEDDGGGTWRRDEVTLLLLPARKAS